MTMNTSYNPPFNLKITLLSLLLISLLSANPPAWSVNPADYSSTANVRALLYVDEVLATDPANILGAFAGDVCRGVSQPVNILDTWIYFLTVYANTDGEELSFRAYVAGEDVVVPVIESIVFSNGANYGSAYDPIPLNALIYLDHAPGVMDIPDQEIPPGGTFAAFDLDDYLIELDGNPVSWNVSGQTDLLVTIDPENGVTVQAPASDWSGSELLTFTATDLMDQGLSGADNALFTVLPFDHPPAVLDIPDQMVPFGGSFTDVALDDYLVELDGDQVSWSYHFLPPLVEDQDPAWSVNPGDFELSMTITARVVARGMETENPADQLAAFVGNECRGVVTPIFAIDSWFYFLTVYADQNGEEITLKFYDATNSILLPVSESYVFINNYAFGSPLNPEILQAEFLHVTIDPQDNAIVEIRDPNWLGSETIVYTATDQNTLNSFAGSDFVTYSYTGPFDLPPFINPIPEQVVDEGSSFVPFDLDDYLLELDGDPVFWTVSGNTDLTVLLDADNLLTVTPPDENWFGSEELLIAVTDDTPTQLSDLTAVQFSVTSVNDPPFPVADLGDLELLAGTSADFNVDLFDDIEGNPLTYAGTSSDESVVEVSLVETLGTVAALRPGTADVTVSAYDGNGGTGTIQFNVIVTCDGIIDCNGDCNGAASLDYCGVCSGGNTAHESNSDMDCNGDCFGSAAVDDCGVCSGGNSNHEAGSDIDCNGDCFGTAFFDDCNVCSGGSSGHAANSDIDACNVCPDGSLGTGSNDPAPEGYDFGAGPDCSGECFGVAFIDDCGVCSAGSSDHEANSDMDCNGDCFGSAAIDDCGVCSGGNTAHESNSDMDCNGDCFGSAEPDACGVCSGGNSNHEAGSDIDCNGDCFGIACENECGCVGGDTGLPGDACYGCTDPEAVNYDPSSNFEDDSCAYAGDFNGDGTTDVSDVVLIVDWIISNQLPTDDLLLTCDLTGEGEITVVDLVLIIQIIIGDYALETPLTAAALLLKPTLVEVQSEGPAAGFQLMTRGDFNPDPASLPAGWQLRRGDGQLLIFNLQGLTLERGILFRYSGSLDIQDNVVTDWHGNSLSARVVEIPEVFGIRQICPNPFNPVTAITYDLPDDREIQLGLYNIQGVLIRELVAGFKPAGTYRYNLDGRDLSSGLYLIRLTSGRNSALRKVILLK